MGVWLFGMARSIFPQLSATRRMDVGTLLVWKSKGWISKGTQYALPMSGTPLSRELVEYRRTGFLFLTSH
jgi:hypothetical protein